MSKQEDEDVKNIDEGSAGFIAAASPTEIKNALYARCANLGAEKVFTQRDLLAFKIIPNDDLTQLLSCTKQLTQEGLFKLMSKDGRACWKVVMKEDAAKYKSLSLEEAMVYSYVESSGREGTWIRLLRVRTQLHMTVLNRSLKSLETKNLIKQIKTMKFPGRKTYMLTNLHPLEDATGGPFYADGAVDEDFVYQMSRWAERYVIGRSWQHFPGDTACISKRKSRAKPPTQEEAKNLRAQELGSHNKPLYPQRSTTMLPMPPGYIGYPTVSELTRAINASDLSPVKLKEIDMRQLLDILCYDGRLQPSVDGKGYKAVRVYVEDGKEGRGEEQRGGGLQHNALMETPCGRCPVADICEEGGPVNAESCEYFQEWLEI